MLESFADQVLVQIKKLSMTIEKAELPNRANRVACNSVLQFHVAFSCANTIARQRLHTSMRLLDL